MAHVQDHLTPDDVFRSCGAQQLLHIPRLEMALINIRALQFLFDEVSVKSLGELEKAVKTLACLSPGSRSHIISRSPKLPLVFLLNN